MSLRVKWTTKFLDELLKEEFFDLSRAVEKDSLGLNPLGLCVLYQRWDLTEGLLEKKTDPNISCSDGITALHMMFIKYNPNMFPLPKFLPSYFYFYTEGISPLCLIVEQDRIPVEFITQLAENGAQLLPDKWKVTGLTFARMAKLDNEIKLLYSLFDLSVRDVIEGPLLKSVPNSMASMPITYLTVSLKHGLPVSETTCVHYWNTEKGSAERYLGVLEKIRAVYSFPSMPLKIYLNVPFTALTHQYNSTNPTPEDDGALYKVFCMYLELIGTSYPYHFIESFSDDALKMANKEVRIIYLFLILLETYLDSQYKNDSNIEWFTPIDYLFDTNYHQLLKLNMNYAGATSNEKGDGLVNRLAMIISRVNVYCRYDTRLDSYSMKWVSALSEAMCRIKPLMTIIVMHSDGLNESGNLFAMINFLLMFGANINERDNKSLTTCLHTVVERNNPKLFKYLIEKNAYVFTVDQNGHTPIDLIDLKYPNSKDYEDNKLNPPFALKSLAARKVSDHYKLDNLFPGHQDSQIWNFMKLHYKAMI